MDELIREILKRSPRSAAHVEAEAEEFVRIFGSVEDALLFIQWADQSKQIPPDDLERHQVLLNTFEAKATGPQLGQEIRSRLNLY